MNILITAFEPFGNENINSTLELLPYLPRRIDDKIITTAVLPVVFDGCKEKLRKAIANKEYSYIICLGQNSFADSLNVERVAINIADARIPDNSGAQPADEPILKDGAPAYFATLPIKQMVKASLDAGVQAQVSNSAGAFVCNCVMYHVLHITAGTDTKAGFIHVPQTPAQAAGNANPSMASDTAAKGIAAMIAAL